MIIYRQEVKDHLVHKLWGLALDDEAGREYYEYIAFNKLEDWIDELPSAQEEQGEWVKVNPLTDTLACSKCDYNIISEEFITPYCPWCGAPMKNGEVEGL